MEIKLDSYQEDALNQMHNGCILCGGVGSGKSRTGLAYYYKTQLEHSYEAFQDLIIITTAKKRDNKEWLSELDFFDGYSQRHNATVDSWNNIQKYATLTGAFFIFDEQRVVGSGAWVKAFLKIAKQNNWILLSATPGDTWLDYAPVFIANGFYKNITEFKRMHVVYSYVTKFPKVDRYVNTKRLVYLRKQILVMMDYHKHTQSHNEVVDIPYDITKYKSVIRDRWNPFDDCPIENASQFCYILRKVVNSDGHRVDAVIEIVRSHPKVIIFYNHDYELELLKERLGTIDNFKVAEWNGHKHQDLPEGDSWAYLVQYTAGAEGWNCITADTVIFYSQTYSYKQLVQSAGRIDRRNTPFTDLYYYHLRSKSSIDIAISRALIGKKKFNEQKFATGF